VRPIVVNHPWYSLTLILIFLMRFFILKTVMTLISPQ
jgi:hypothetical protein